MKIGVRYISVRSVKCENQCALPEMCMCFLLLLFCFFFVFLFFCFFNTQTYRALVGIEGERLHGHVL